MPWRYLVVDEAHRLKNRDSALANDLRSLRIEHCHLLSGTPLQNNTTELWALLSFLDPSLFPTLQGFVDDFGTLTDADQVRVRFAITKQHNSRLRVYCLFRCSPWSRRKLRLLRARQIEDITNGGRHRLYRECASAHSLHLVFTVG